MRIFQYDSKHVCVYLNFSRHIYSLAFLAFSCWLRFSAEPTALLNRYRQLDPPGDYEIAVELGMRKPFDAYFADTDRRWGIRVFLYADSRRKRADH